MTVRELITELGKYPDNKPVIVNDTLNGELCDVTGLYAWYEATDNPADSLIEIEFGATKE